MEAVKSYRIPVEAPKDFLAHVRFSNKAHLSISREDRRKLRDELLKDWRFSKHYVDSAINSVIGLVKSWITLYNRGKAESKPKITKRTVYIKSTLFSFRNV
ncbi:MAG: hypothetical protein QW342_04835 [Thermoproteota archaeon]